MSEQPTDKKQGKSSLKDFLTRPVMKTDSKTMQYSGLGITLAVTILVFLFAGMWLDGKLGTKPWLTLIFTLIGFGGGFYSFYLSIRKLTADDEKENPRFNKY